jgi:hypothetical protein
MMRSDLMKLSLPAWAQVLSRVLAAILGGYVFSYAVTAALARLLPLAPEDALIVATLPAFVFYTLAALWAFAARDAWRAWAGVALALPLLLIGFWPHVLGRLA